MYHIGKGSLMKKIYLLSVFLIIVSIGFAISHTVTFPNQGANVQVSQMRNDGLVLEWSVKSMLITEKTTDNGIFTNLEIDGFVGNNQVGLPELPYLGRFITVPVNAQINVNFINSNVTEVSLKELGFENFIYPAQPSYSKSQDMSKVSFIYHQDSYRDADYAKNHTPFSFKEAGFMRGQRIFEVIYNPVHYNPVDNTIRVYDNLRVELNFENSDYAQTDYLRAKTWSAEYEKVFQYFLLNYESPTNRSELERFPTKYIIVCHEPFVEAMQAFVEWKTQIGFEVIMASTADPAVGNTTSSIKAFIQGLWDAATPEDPAPSFVLFVGDVAQIPAWNAQASPSGHVTDLTYVRLEGNDFLPEMYYGRFSANNLAELTPQIEKTLMYEKYEMPDPDYLERAVLIAGHDSYWAPTHANGQINYMNHHYFNEQNGYPNPYVYLYPASSSHASTIVNNVSAGLGWANYTAHGLHDQWGDPYFSIPNIYSLNNYGMYPIAIGNCCQTSKFEIYECFGEAWLRAPGKGAVIYIGGTNNTYWNEDYWWAVGHVTPPSNGSAASYNPAQLGMYDMLFHTHGEAIEDWHVTTGAMKHAGNMVVQGTNSDKKNYYWEIYSIMGDPSLIPYLGVPSQNYAQYPSQILIGQQQININNSAPFARVSLSFEGEVYGSVFTNEMGSATLQFNPFVIPGNATIVITAQNHQPIIDTIQIIPADGPYIVFETVVNQTTGDNSVDFATQSSLNISVNNVGSVVAEDLTVSLTSNSNFVQIVQGTVNINSIPAEQVYQIAEPFVISVNPNVANGAVANLILTVTGAGNLTWTMPLQLTVNAPDLSPVGFDILDTTGNNNGRLDPGETAQIVLTFVNAGNAPSLAGNIMVASTNPMVSIQMDSAEISSIFHNQEGQYTFTVTVDEATEAGALTSLSYFANFVSQNIQENYTLPIGLVVEDFESGDFTALPWQNTSVTPWSIVSEDAYQGQYSARSGAITHNQTSILQVPYSLETAGTIEFALKTSCENNYDKLQFYINNAVVGNWSGETPWTVVSFNVPAGNHTFKWVYRKDANNTEGADAAWVDYIVFPSAGGGNVINPIAGVSSTELDLGTVGMSGVASARFNLINLGNQILAGNISVSEGFFLNTTPSFTINPFQNNEYIVTFTSTTPGTYNGNITINTNDPNNSEITINLTVTVSGVNEEDMVNTPLITRLKGNYPNPFNPETKINFDLKDNSNVSIEIFNIRGQKVKTLINEQLNKGQHSVIWNGKDADNRSVASGIYFYRMSSENYSATGKMLLMK